MSIVEKESSLSIEYGLDSTVEYQTKLLEHVEEEGLRAVGEVVRLGRRIAVAEMKVWTDSEKLVAVSSGTFTVTSKPLPVAP